MTPAHLLQLANHLWQSTLFAAAVGLLTMGFRQNRARVRYALWLAASLKFLIPFSLLVAIGSQMHLRTTPITAPVAPLTFVVQQIGQPFVPAPAPMPAPRPAAPNWVAILLAGLWGCGFLANLIPWVHRWRSIRASLRAASPIPVDLPIPVMTSPLRLEPGVFGIRRPVLLLPAGLLDHLTSSQLELILAHELCHVRRRDNLAAAVHMLVEALFWFHPLVWWIETRLVAERERACDEEVLRAARDPEDYAEGILKICSLCLESPLACVSGVTGADLKKRIEAIMANRLTRTREKTATTNSPSGVRRGRHRRAGPAAARKWTARRAATTRGGSRSCRESDNRHRNRREWTPSRRARASRRRIAAKHHLE